MRFEERGRKHSAMRRCRVCSVRGDVRNVKTMCEKCDVAHALRSTTPKQIAETFQAIHRDLPT